MVPFEESLEIEEVIFINPCFEEWVGYQIEVSLAERVLDEEFDVDRDIGFGGIVPAAYIAVGTENNRNGLLLDKHNTF